MDDDTLTAFWVLLICAGGLLVIGIMATIESGRFPGLTRRYDALVRRIRGY